MKNVALISTVVVILLSSCATNNLEKYPRYIEQKENISDMVLVVDYAFQQQDLGETYFYTPEQCKLISDYLTDKIADKLRMKNYRFETIFTVIDDIPVFALPIREKMDTLNKQKVRKNARSTRRIGKRNKVFPKTINFEYMYFDTFGNYDSSIENVGYNKVYYDLFPNRIDSAKKIIAFEDTLTKKDIPVAIMVYVRGATVSWESQVTGALITGLASGLASGGTYVYSSFPVDFGQIILVIADREDNDIIWKDFRFRKNLNPTKDTDIFLSLLEDMLDDLPDYQDSRTTEK